MTLQVCRNCNNNNVLKIWYYIKFGICLDGYRSAQTDRWTGDLDIQSVKFGIKIHTLN